ncbi:MAG: alpha/beta hydrolase-fold protein [Pseudomonadales bacterium]
MPTPRETIELLQLDRPIPEQVNGRRNGVDNDPSWDAAYHPCPEAFPADNVNRGMVTKLENWAASAVYPGTRRDLWIYAPPGVSADAAANAGGTNVRLIFFNDGAWYLSRGGPVRATRVLDSLHHAGEIEPTAAVFIMPGDPGGPVPAPIESYDARTAQRSLEYDSLTPRYGTFLFTEILPLVEQETGLRISKDPGHRLTCGISSGGIAAFTAAWHHPGECTRVLSHCGSFTDIWGGHNYPSLVRRTPRKPIRVLLQSGANDADTPFGNWALANQAMASALGWAGYDYRFEFGTGGHNLHHGGAIFADSVRWLWRGDED